MTDDINDVSYSSTLAKNNEVVRREALGDGVAQEMLASKPVAYAIYVIGGGKIHLHDVKKITDDEWKCDDGGLGDYWSGNEPLYASPRSGQMSAAIAPLEQLPRRLDWLLGCGQTRPDEPLYGCQIRDGENIVAEAEHDDLNQCVSLAIKNLKGLPCEYCIGKYTGLPGNACENCMNTGMRYPELDEPYSRSPGETVGMEELTDFFTPQFVHRRDAASLATIILSKFDLVRKSAALPSTERGHE